MFCYRIDDQFRSNFPFFIRRDDVAELLLSHFNRDFLFFQAAAGHKFIEGTFQFTDVGFDIGSDIFDDVIIYLITVKFFFFPEDCHTCFVVGRGDVCNKTPFKAGTETSFQSLHFFRRFIRRNNDLLFIAVQIIKSMEKFFLRGFFSYNELDIINKKYVNIAVFLTKTGSCSVVVVTDGFDQFIRKGFTGHIKYLCFRISF